MLNANFGQHLRRSWSEIISESAEALEAQRRSLMHEAMTEMMRREARKEEVLSQLRSELRYDYHHPEGQS